MTPTACGLIGAAGIAAFFIAVGLIFLWMRWRDLKRQRTIMSYTVLSNRFQYFESALEGPPQGAHAGDEFAVWNGKRWVRRVCTADGQWHEVPPHG